MLFFFQNKYLCIYLHWFVVHMSQMQITWFFFFFFLHKAVDVVNVIIKEIADLISTSPSVTSILRHLYSYFIISYSRVFGIFFFLLSFNSIIYRKSHFLCMTNTMIHETMFVFIISSTHLFVGNEHWNVTCILLRVIT